jgi:RNA polymerase sigma-70 factor (ECF subfamily)
LESGELSELVAGSKAAWDRFVVRYMPVVYAAVQRRLIPAGYGADCDDVVQDVFLRLCARDFRLVRNYDPKKAKISTWLTVIASSCSIDHLRRQKGKRQALDDTPEADLAVDPDIKERIKIPEGLLSPRQSLVLDLLYKKEMEVSEAADFLGVDPQTVRSTHHKALTKLRKHFQDLEEI